MSKLAILGVWNELPLTAWPWFADNSVNQFFKITRVKVRNFTYVKDKLHYQYLLAEDVNKLYDLLDSNFIQKIIDDYYVQSKRIVKMMKRKFDNSSKFVEYIKEINDNLSYATMHIWFVLLLDIWFPKIEDKEEWKRIGAKARDHSGNLHNKAKKILKKIINDISKDIGEDVSYLFPEELSLKSKSRLINERKKLCVTTNIFGKYRIFEGKKAEELLRKYLPKSKNMAEKLKGMPANPGKIKGKVRIILLHEQFKDFKDGEILVALQTMINYVPIMEKAKAILTEYGGVTSHAAIVSRELNKPCIVGIAGITSNLKDGDLVEVDANKGIVRKIK